MDRFQLATLVHWAGSDGVHGRKRLQKVVFCLQSASCPLDADFALHLYGPYSRDVADICDEMVAANLLVERVEEHASGKQYTYSLPPATEVLLSQVASADPARVTRMEAFAPLATSLLAAPLWHLELGSTILYYHLSNSSDWQEATKRACEFKQVPVDSPETDAALALAQMVVQQSP